MSAPIVTPLDWADAQRLAEELCPVAAGRICPPHDTNRCELCQRVARALQAVDCASRAQALADYKHVELVTALRALVAAEEQFTRLMGVVDPDTAAMKQAHAAIGAAMGDAHFILAVLKRLLCSATCAKRYGHTDPCQGATPRCGRIFEEKHGRQARCTKPAGHESGCVGDLVVVPAEVRA